MLKAQGEIRIIWLMLLMIVGVATWFLGVPLLSYLCALALLISVVHYVDAIAQPTAAIVQKTPVPIQTTSKIPLYIASLVAGVGLVMHWHWLVAVGVTLWIFFFLRWLRRLEQDLIQVQYYFQHQDQHNSFSALAINPKDQLVEDPDATAQLPLLQQLQQWIFRGNPVLKVAIMVLVVGIILLLRFASEHWQLELAFQLGVMAVICMLVSGLGYRLLDNNRGFGLGLEGLGMAGLCLCLFFAYYNQLILSLGFASLLFIGLMLSTVWLSLKQQSIELALMAMLIAYIAPFTLPVRQISSVELLAYYWVINLAVALLSSLRPWKILTQITFLLTVVIATGYALLHPQAEKLQLLVLILAHSVIFIWLGFRYSQLLAKQDLQQFKLNPVLDVALIFGAPMVAYGLIYLIYFQDRIWQASLSLMFVLVYAALYVLAKRMQSIAIIAQSYFSLMLIFITFIPPILLESYWSVIGWSVEAVLIFIFALERRSIVGRYLALALSVVAGLSGIYYWVVDEYVPRLLYWCLSIIGLKMVLIANARSMYREQYDLPMLLLHILQMLSSVSLLMWLISDAWSLHRPEAGLLLVMAVALFLLNEWMYRTQARWSWVLMKTAALIPLMLYAFYSLSQYAVAGQLVWTSEIQRWLFVVAALLMSAVFLRSKVPLEQMQELSSFVVLVNLGVASLGLVPSMPYVSVVILPTSLVIWSWVNRVNQPHVSLLWQSHTNLVLMAVWMACSQLFAQSAFSMYVLPILNPFDAMSLVMLLCFLWMLTLQLQTRIDRGIVAVLAVLSVLWLSSYILLRALHVYFATPYNQVQLWQDATVQFSLTLLWVSLAFVTMTIATKKSIRALWILGASLLVIVTLKLVLLDLSHVGALFRVFSFLGSGLIMLVIAYIAPIPEPKHNAEHPSKF